MLATALTGGAASPLLASTLIGAGTGAGMGAIDNGWKGALTGAATGALGGAVGGGMLPKIPNGGVIMNATAGSGGKVAGNAWLTDLLKNPQTYGTLLDIVKGASGGGGGGTTQAGTTGPYQTSGAGGGGGSGALADILRGAGGAGAGAAAGMAKERENENLYGINANNAATSRYGIEQSARSNLLGLQEQGRMDRASLGITAPDKRANQVVRGSLIANVQDAQMSHPRAHIPNITGGLRPSALSPAAREAGGVLQQQGLDALKSKSDIPEMADFMGEGMVKPPETPEYKGAGGLEQGLGIAGTGSSFLSSILDALAKQAAAKKAASGQPPTPPGTPPPAYPPSNDPYEQEG